LSIQPFFRSNGITVSEFDEKTRNCVIKGLLSKDSNGGNVVVANIDFVNILRMFNVNSNHKNASHII
jgi:hypothetical protein